MKTPKHPVRIGYLEVNKETGEVITYDENGVRDVPLKRSSVNVGNDAGVD